MLLILVTLIGLVAGVWVLIKREEQRHVRQGYWVEYLSPGRVRDDKETFAVVYHEAERWQFFYGKTARRGELDRLLFPDEAAWQSRSPNWLNGKRVLVLSRIQKDLKRIEITIVPEFPSAV